MNLIRDVVQGAGYLEGYGDHPGTPIMLGFILAGGVVGLERGGVYGFLAGAFAMVVGVGPFWMMGCVDRARGYQRRNKRT